MTTPCSEEVKLATKKFNRELELYRRVEKLEDQIKEVMLFLKGGFTLP